MQYQRVTTGIPTETGPPAGLKTKNAVAGVGARNGVKQKVSTKKRGSENTTPRPALASRLVALIERDGTVAGLIRRPDEVRAFLQGGGQ